MIKQSNAITASLAAIWVGTIATSMFAPEMITGSQHEHLPIVPLTAWIWAIFATGLVVLLSFVDKKQEKHISWPILLLAMLVIWGTVALAGMAFPPLITGTDPTQIPLASMIVPVLGAVATAYVCLFMAVRQPK